MVETRIPVTPDAGIISQTRDASDTVLKRDLPEGEFTVSSSTKLVYMPDQLGSVRDVLNATTGTRVASYDYTPYGAVARSNVTTGTDYQYAGLWKHTQSTLNLAMYICHGLLMIESPQSFIVSTECGKAAEQHGFRRRLGDANGWAAFQSTTAQGTIWLAANGSNGPWFLALNHIGIIEELNKPGVKRSYGLFF